MARDDRSRKEIRENRLSQGKLLLAFSVLIQISIANGASPMLPSSTGEIYFCRRFSWRYWSWLSKCSPLIADKEG